MTEPDYSALAGPTPRTDAKLKFLAEHPDDQGVWFSYDGLAHFACDLERELAAVKVERDQLVEDAVSFSRQCTELRAERDALKVQVDRFMSAEVNSNE